MCKGGTNIPLGELLGITKMLLSTFSVSVIDKKNINNTKFVSRGLTIKPHLKVKVTLCFKQR